MRVPFTVLKEKGEVKPAKWTHCLLLLAGPDTEKLSWKSSTQPALELAAMTDSICSDWSLEQLLVL